MSAAQDCGEQIMIIKLANNVDAFRACPHRWVYPSTLCLKRRSLPRLISRGSSCITAQAGPSSSGSPAGGCAMDWGSMKRLVTPA